jgi:anti-anti-sigma regulatory factor
MPIRSVEYGEDAVRVVVLGQLTGPDLELIRDGLSRGPGGIDVVIDLRDAPVPDAGALLSLAGMLRDSQAHTKIVGISRTSERLLAHLGVHLATDGSS